MTKYEKLYGKPVSHFPNEEANVREKLKLATEQLKKFDLENPTYTYENQVIRHELNQAIGWCRKILDDIGN